MEYPNNTNDAAVEPAEEICEEEVLPNSVVQVVENELLNVMEGAMDTYNIGYQIERNHQILSEKFEELIDSNKKINEKLTIIENQLKPKRINLLPLDITESQSVSESPLEPPPKKFRAISDTQFSPENLQLCKFPSNSQDFSPIFPSIQPHLPTPSSEPSQTSSAPSYIFSPVLSSNSSPAISYVFSLAPSLESSQNFPSEALSTESPTVSPSETVTTFPLESSTAAPLGSSPVYPHLFSQNISSGSLSSPPSSLIQYESSSGITSQPPPPFQNVPSDSLPSQPLPPSEAPISNAPSETFLPPPAPIYPHLPSSGLSYQPLSIFPNVPSQGLSSHPPPIFQNISSGELTPLPPQIYQPIPSSGLPSYPLQIFQNIFLSYLPSQPQRLFQNVSSQSLPSQPPLIFRYEFSSGPPSQPPLIFSNASSSTPSSQPLPVFSNVFPTTIPSQSQPTLTRESSSTPCSQPTQVFSTTLPSKSLPIFKNIPPWIHSSQPPPVSSTALQSECRTIYTSQSSLTPSSHPPPALTLESPPIYRTKSSSEVPSQPLPVSTNTSLSPIIEPSPIFQNRSSELVSFEPSMRLPNGSSSSLPSQTLPVVSNVSSVAVPTKSLLSVPPNVPSPSSSSPIFSPIPSPALLPGLSSPPSPSLSSAPLPALSSASSPGPLPALSSAPSPAPFPLLSSAPSPAPLPAPSSPPSPSLSSAPSPVPSIILLSTSSSIFSPVPSSTPSPISPLAPSPATSITSLQEPPTLTLLASNSTNLEPSDILNITEVKVPVELPPLGNLSRPAISVGCSVYVMKLSLFSIWVKAKVIEIQKPNYVLNYHIKFDCPQHGNNKFVSGKQIAYSMPSNVRYPVGTRVIAMYKKGETSAKSAYYVGIVAEPPKILNAFRYLIFFDDGYAQYVPHEKILLVYESSVHVYEDVHPNSRDFIKFYLDQYPERPMVKLQKGQHVKMEWNGKWWSASVLEIDGSLVKMCYHTRKTVEWIYRGSTRLEPLFLEYVASTARKEQRGLLSFRNLGVKVKKEKKPYVEYQTDPDEEKTFQPSKSRNVAKKSTHSKSNSQHQNLAPPKPNEIMEYVTKGEVRQTTLEGGLQGKELGFHQCSPFCMLWTKYSPKKFKGINPLAIPLLYGFQRKVMKSIEENEVITYEAPCGKEFQNLKKLHQYLMITKSKMKMDLFDFNTSVNVLNEFYLESKLYRTYIKDISYGQENVPIPCVNEINTIEPSVINYSASRLPQEGVNICLDEEFLICCSCEDDCQDKQKCECWQLTIEGTKLDSKGQPDYSVGYHYKRLLAPVPTGIYECNNRCSCNSTCLNKVVQFSFQLNLQVFRTLKKGWGVRAINDIPKGGFICTYAGGIHTEEDANNDGQKNGDEYLAALDYIEVVEKIKEGYEHEVIEPRLEKDTALVDVNKELGKDVDYVPQKFKQSIEQTNVKTRSGNKINYFEEDDEEDDDNISISSKSLNTEEEVEGPAVKPTKGFAVPLAEKTLSKFTATIPHEIKENTKHKLIREMFGDKAKECYILNAKHHGNIGRYLNHSCQPNLFVQNVFVDTHDVRFPSVAFFALTNIKAGTELTWDYNYDVGSVPGKVLYCYCNSPECRGRLL